MDKLFEIFKSLLDGLTLRGRWTAVIGFATSLLVLLVLFELFTGVFFYRSLRQKVDLLDSLSKMEQQGIKQSPELYPVYRQTVAELSLKSVSPILIPRIALNPTENTLKAVSGSLFWFLLVLAAVFGAFGESNRLVGTVFMLVMTGLFAYLATLIPTLGSVAVNIILGLVVQLLVLIMISRLGSRMNKSAKAGRTL